MLGALTRTFASLSPKHGDETTENPTNALRLPTTNRPWQNAWQQHDTTATERLSGCRKRPAPPPVGGAWKRPHPSHRPWNSTTASGPTHPAGPTATGGCGGRRTTATATPLSNGPA